ncbi:MTR1 [Symbiodinium natans]|uniref:MTR1 protein n=1 Tax=Symbiodinium natans TaxID=878477 RepID=A0A812K5C6_9DINO|nr:MTR1 [Symbiodinium natans]
MGEKKEKIKTKASKEAMRWADGDTEGPIERGPTEAGNDFDIRMQDEPDGMLAAQKIVQVLKEKGVCLVQANAPKEIVFTALDEAESLWEEGEFKPPMRVHDDRSLLEAQLWRQALQDVDKAVWIRESDCKAIQLKNALKLLGKNMADFCAGLGPLLEKEMGVSFDRLGQPLLTCYTGERQYSVHIDNPHSGEDQGLPDNGMRTLVAELSDVRALKQRLHEQQGLPPRFRQRLLHEGCTLEDGVKLDSEMDLQVVVLTFSDVSDDQRRALVFAARDGNVVKVEAMLQIPMDPDDAVKGERDGHDTALMVRLHHEISRALGILGNS